jgi:hypothetical protein
MASSRASNGPGLRASASLPKRTSTNSDATRIHTHTFPLKDLPTAIRYAKDRVEDARSAPRGFGQPSFYVALPHGSWSFLTTTLSIVGWIYDPDHSLPPGMYVDVPHLDCLLVAAPITLEGLDQLILKPKQLDAITAVYVDVVFGHLAMALSKKS